MLTSLMVERGPHVRRKCQIIEKKNSCLTNDILKVVNQQRLFEDKQTVNMYTCLSTQEAKSVKEEGENKCITLTG